MGASGWNYTVPYQSDFNRALYELRAAVFADEQYHWPRRDQPRPATVGRLLADDWVQQSGTHSILDVSRVLDRGDPPEFGAIEVLSAADLLGRGGGLPTRDHTDLVDQIVEEEWAPNRVARFSVLYDDAGKPDEIYVSGITGD